MSGFELPNYLDDMNENFADEAMSQPDGAEDFNWSHEDPIVVEEGTSEEPVAEAQPASPEGDFPDDQADESEDDASEEFADDFSDESFSAPADEQSDVPAEAQPDQADETDESVETVVPVAEDTTQHVPVEDAPAIENSVINDDFFLNDGVAGNHFQWQDVWFWQEVDGYCGPTAAAFLLNQFAGAGINNPEYMVEQAVNMGYMDDPSLGMTTGNLADLLSSCGLPMEHVQSSVYDLAAKLEMGYGVIACVDSGELWGEESDSLYEDNTPDHFLVVSEIDFNLQTVTLTDPGAPFGNGLEVSLAQFEDAWEDSNFEMISTTQYSEELADANTQNSGMALVNATRSDRIR